MSSTGRARPSDPEPATEPEPQAPDSLEGLLKWVMDKRGYANLRQLSRATEVPYQTLYTWLTKSRNHVRPPKDTLLRQFASDLSLSEALVFHAAGRTYGPADSSEEDLQVLHLWHELSPEDRVIAEQMLRSLAERARKQSASPG